ncbi:signal peptidase II [Methylacidimicrobium sp. B4]|uniref:signal peptidase II n=1 Tax=Methylacidimicrobium sp. B4 TaxID=2796139 RepID=UPI001A8E6046|nr:signal peptidase II [Methylacidimicrobium sp. B4]QSR83998.1 signal peptidase II [Methylacidimicrobium sp. B4]
MRSLPRLSSASPGALSPREGEPEALWKSPGLLRRRAPRPLFWGLFLALLLFDQGSKGWILEHGMDLPLSLVPGLLNVVSVRNTGIVFGLFAGHNWLWIGVGASFLLAGFLVGKSLDWSRRETNVIAALLAAGATGNIIDRVVHGFVVDFIDAYVGSWHWPSFNVADSCLCVASLWIIFRWVIVPKSRP